MASKYLKKFPIPQQLPLVLHDFAKAVMMQQPRDVVQFAAEYFKALAEDRELTWEEAEPRVPRPVGYPRVKGGKPQTARSEKEQTSVAEPPAASTPHAVVPVSSIALAAECAKEFVGEMVEKVLAQRQARV
jgi:hypothetical protein